MSYTSVGRTHDRPHWYFEGPKLSHVLGDQLFDRPHDIAPAHGSSPLGERRVGWSKLAGFLTRRPETELPSYRTSLELRALPLGLEVGYHLIQLGYGPSRMRHRIFTTAGG